MLRCTWDINQFNCTTELVQTLHTLHCSMQGLKRLLDYILQLIWRSQQLHWLSVHVPGDVYGSRPFKNTRRAPIRVCRELEF